MWKVFVLALGPWFGSEIVDVFFSDTGLVLAEVASLMPDIGSTVAYDRAATVERKIGRLEARRRDVEVRRAAIVTFGVAREADIGVIYESSRFPARCNGFHAPVTDRGGRMVGKDRCCGSMTGWQNELNPLPAYLPSCHVNTLAKVIIICDNIIGRRDRVRKPSYCLSFEPDCSL